MNHINPMFTEKKPPKRHSPSPPPSPSKRRSDKKHDIRIPISAQNKGKLRELAYRNQKNMTGMTTLLLLQSLDKHHTFLENTYENVDTIVHAKVSEETYQVILEWAIQWECSVRQAATRIFFMEFFLTKGVVVLDEI